MRVWGQDLFLIIKDEKMMNRSDFINDNFLYGILSNNQYNTAYSL